MARVRTVKRTSLGNKIATSTGRSTRPVRGTTARPKGKVKK